MISGIHVIRVGRYWGWRGGGGCPCREGYEGLARKKEMLNEEGKFQFPLADFILLDTVYA